MRPIIRTGEQYEKISVPTPRQLPSGSWRVQLLIDGKRISVTEDSEQACIARAMAIREKMLEPVDKSVKPTLTVAIDRYIESRENILSRPQSAGTGTFKRKGSKN